MRVNVLQKIRYAAVVLATTLPVIVSADNRHEIVVRDLPYGVSLYHFFQENSLLAITELNVANHRNLLSNQSDDAELLKGGLFTSYGLVDDAERIFEDLLKKKTSQQTQDRIWFNLANIQYNRGNYDSAFELLNRISGTLPERNEQRKQYLLTNLNIMQGKLGAAARISDLLPEESVWKGYTQYNMGIALKQNPAESERWLQKLNRPSRNDEEALSLADASNLALGLFSLNRRAYADATVYASRVRDSGPLSNKALLATGWAWSKRNNPDMAISFWQALVDKGHEDLATQEALLAMPFAYEQKGNLELSALMYNRAAVRFNEMLSNMDAAIAALQQGELLDALREQYALNNLTVQELGRKLPRTSATPYLHDIFANNEFQREIQRFQELLDMQVALGKWQKDLPALDLMLDERRAAFLAKRPLIEKSSGLQQLKDLQQQRDKLAVQVDKIERLADYKSLADETESGYLQQLSELKNSLDRLKKQRDMSEELQQYRLLSGIMRWTLETEFPARFWRIKKELQLLDDALAEALDSAQGLKKAARQNENILDRFEQEISGQFASTKSLQTKVSNIIKKQEQNINRLAIDALQSRKQHLVQLRLNARYSQVRLYDQLLVNPDGKE